MISNLRKKLILINVISVFIVSVIAIVVVFVLGYQRITDERLARLNALLEDGNWSEDKLISGTVSIEYDLTTKQFDVRGKNSEVGLKDEQIGELVQEAVESKENGGLLNARVLYAKSEVDGVIRVVLYDRYSSSSNIKTFVVSAISLTVFVALCYFTISYFVASLALKPIEDSWTKQKQFVADASHELKTPLSVIMANTDIVTSHQEDTVASQMRWLDNTRQEAERMAGLVNDMLFLAKNDDGLKSQMEVVNLSESIETIVLGHEAIFYEHGKTFTYDITPNVQVMANDGQIKQLATILLDNANKYSTDVGNVTLSVTTQGKHAQVVVSNDCEPLTDEQLKHLFDRFYTVDQSRNKSNAGNGLGLSIAQMICKLHRGDLAVNYADGRATFTATFPIYKAK